MSDEHEFELVMPFLVTASNGGTYEDDAYVAGFEAGRIEGVLQHEALSWAEFTVHADNVPQLDLIAMRCGYTMTVEPFDGLHANWRSVTFEEANADAGGVMGDADDAGAQAMVALYHAVKDAVERGWVEQMHHPDTATAKCAGCAVMVALSRVEECIAAWELETSAAVSGDGHRTPSGATTGTGEAGPSRGASLPLSRLVNVRNIQPEFEDDD